LLRHATVAVEVRIGAATLTLGGFLWLVYLGLTWDMRSAAREAAAAFRPVPVVRGDLRETVVATGVLEPHARVVVQSEISGVVARVHVDDGERVSAQQPLVELDPQRLEDRAAQLRAAYEWRRALTRVDLVGRAQTELSEHVREHERIAALFSEGVSSQHQLDRAQHLLSLARIAVGDALAEAEAREAAADQAAAAYDRARRDLAETVIRSPIDGLVVRRAVEVGTAVADLQNGGTVVAVLADDRSIHLLADVDENDVAAVRVDQLAEVRIDAFPDEIFEGRVRRVSWSGTAAGSVSNFQIEVEIEPDQRIRVGMSADARIVIREHRGALLVPNTAVLRDAAGPRVRLARGKQGFELAPIREIYSDGFHTAVEDGVTGEDTVLVRSDGPAQWQP
jgi:HlyD family secretion protein